MMTRKRSKKAEMGIPRARIERLVRELVLDLRRGDFKVQADVFEILRGASEAMLVELFQQANVVRSASRREKMHVSHLQCARGIMQQAQGV